MWSGGCHLDLLGSGVSTGPGPVEVPGETVDVSGDVTGHTRVLVPVPSPAHLLPGLQDLVPFQPDIVQFLPKI